MRHVTVALALLFLSIAVEAKDVTYYYTDPQGTVVATADANGNLIAPKDFTPFGKPVLGSSEQGPGYTGHMADADTGLNYMRARYFDPELGRFLSVDPRPVQAANLASFNRFGYVGNNPATLTDPMGEYICNRQTDQCERIASALNDIKSAAGNPDIGGDAQSALQGILAFYGKEGEDNGVTVTTQGARGDRDVGHTTADGKPGAGRPVHVNINLAKLDGLLQNHTKASIASEWGGIVAHEGRHGITLRDHNISRRAVEKDNELDGYRAQGWVNQGLRVNSMYGLWKQGESTLNSGAVERSAEESTELWCQSGGICP